MTAVSYYVSHVLKQTSFQLHLFDVLLSYIKWFQLDHICEQSASNDFDGIFFQELLRIFNALRARRNGDDVFSNRSDRGDYDVYF